MNLSEPAFDRLHMDDEADRAAGYRTVQPERGRCQWCHGSGRQHRTNVAGEREYYDCPECNGSGRMLDETPDDGSDHDYDTARDIADERELETPF